MSDAGATVTDSTYPEISFEARMATVEFRVDEDRARLASAYVAGLDARLMVPVR